MRNRTPRVVVWCTFNFNAPDDGELWRKQRMRALVRDNFTCQWPGCRCSSIHKLTVHHLVPRSQGGSNHLHNLLTLCEKHHRMAHAPALASVSDYVGVQLCSTPK